MAGRGVDEPVDARVIGAPESNPLPGYPACSGTVLFDTGKRAGFFAQGQIKKVRLEGGGVESICATAATPLAAAGLNGTIVFAGFGSGLRAVAASGGPPYQLSVPDVAAGRGRSPLA